MKFVLDSSAVLAYLFDEAAGNQLTSFLEQECCMSAVNLSEVLAKLKARDMDYKAVASLVHASGLEIIDWNSELAWKMEELNLPLRKGLSLADRVCITTGIYYKCVIVSADQIWSTLDLPVKVQLLREKS